MHDAVQDHGHTLAMKVANTGFMLDRLGQDCAPLQFLRELTHNGIEAIQKKAELEGKEPSGKVLWDVDWATYDLTNGEVFKLCVVDDGIGMTGEDQLKYINQLSSSIHHQSHEGNFGVGAKIAAATRNHEGLVYLSWQNGIGNMVQLWRDPDTGQYGLKQHEVGGQHVWWAEVEDTVKPKEISTSGTKVVLLGNAPDQNTMQPPHGVALRTPTKWIRRYLNTRYFAFPQGIEVRVREGWEHPRDDSDRNVTRRVIGQSAYLAQHSDTSGTVELPGAKAHWWILKQDNAIRGNSGESASSGHTAALYNNELYELRESNAGYARLQSFGVYLAYDRVVIYVEPIRVTDETRILPNTARTDLLINNEPLPWTEWATEFRLAMPQAIRDLIESVGESTSQDSYQEAIRERLKRIAHFMRMSRYRRAKTGEQNIDDNLIPGGKSAGGGNSERTGSGRSGGQGGRGGSIYTFFLKSDGEAGEEVEGNSMPKVIWVSVKDKKRVSGTMEDRAAQFLPELNQIQANQDFRVYQDMIEYWTKQYSDMPGAYNTVEVVVREWFEQSLIEAVMGALTLKDSPLWTAEDLARAWSEEALTTAVMLRFHVNEVIKRVLGQKLGSLREKAS